MTMAGIGWPELMAGLPNVPWWLSSRTAQIAIVLFGMLLIAYAFYQQTLREGSDEIRRLYLKKYVAFREIAEALPQIHVAYSKEDIFLQLATAVTNREFESYSGHSRLHVTLRDASGNVESARPIEDGISFLNSAAGLEPTNKNVERALFEAANASPAYSDSIYGALTLEARDFARWYKRFQGGCYEN